MWNLKQEYRDIMVKFEHIEVTEDSLVDESEDEQALMDEAWNTKDQIDRTDEMYELGPLASEFDT